MIDLNLIPSTQFGNHVELIGVVAAGSSTLRHHFRSRDDHHPADDVSHGQVPRNAQQRPGIYETERSAAGPVGARHGLRRLHLGHVQGPGHLHGT